jgi:cytochrome b6-f complex iron-sulfur subunit
VTQVCSHEGKVKVVYQNAEFYCPEHGAKFDVNGRGLNSNGKNGLTVYMTALNGSLLRVTS